MAKSLVNIQKTMENHHGQWVNQLFLLAMAVRKVFLTVITRRQASASEMVDVMMMSCYFFMTQW